MDISHSKKNTFSDLKDKLIIWLFSTGDATITDSPLEKIYINKH